MMLIEGLDYIVRELPQLPGAIRGMVSIGEDGVASIYINANLDQAGKRDALDHELQHLARGDHSSSRSIKEVEQ